MKIFSSFDTDLPKILFDSAKKEYGKDHVCFVRRDSIYLWLRVYLPVFAWLVFSLVILLIMYKVFDSSFLRGIGWFFILSLFLIVKYKALDKTIDYYLDFTIVTPNHITAYDQNGLFKRSTRSLDISKIKSINVVKKGILRSMFNFGSIVFFSEGDDMEMGDITLNYINNPIILKNKINAIIKKNHKQNKH